MAKQERDLFKTLRAAGLRKRVARSVSSAAGSAQGRTPKVVQDTIRDLRALASELEDRATGGSGKRKAAAKKAAATRKRAATKRSTAAKKAAATRARSTRSSSSSRSSSGRGGSTRSRTSRSR
jgi:hypothetical protein